MLKIFPFIKSYFSIDHNPKPKKQSLSNFHIGLRKKGKMIRVSGPRGALLIRVQTYISANRLW